MGPIGSNTKFQSGTYLDDILVQAASRIVNNQGQCHHPEGSGDKQEEREGEELAPLFRALQLSLV
jgi:hypothetical protein